MADLRLEAWVIENVEGMKNTGRWLRHGYASFFQQLHFSVVTLVTTHYFWRVGCLRQEVVAVAERYSNERPRLIQKQAEKNFVPRLETFLPEIIWRLAGSHSGPVTGVGWMCRCPPVASDGGQKDAQCI